MKNNNDNAIILCKRTKATLKSHRGNKCALSEARVLTCIIAIHQSWLENTLLQR
ncbi:hypothetical protein Bresa_02868|nr:hypothetical protein [Brenneria salicis ATCC 15712 = DSM 30166]